MVEIKNLAQVIAQLDAWIASAERLAENVAKGLAAESFKMLLDHSPQYSGDFVANWNVSIGNIDASFTQFQDPAITSTFKVYQNRSAPAMQAAILRNAGKLATFKLGEAIFISNGSSHDQAYAPMVEDDSITWRPGTSNIGRPIAITAGFVHQAYRALDSSTAKTLSRKTI